MDIPIKKLLISAPFKDSVVLAGSLENEKRMGSINIVDYPLGYYYINKNDFVIIGGSDWFIEKDHRLQILRNLKDREVAGIGLYLSRFNGHLPDDMKELAEKLDLDIISLGDAGERLSYKEILSYFTNNFYISTSDKFVHVDYIQKRFYECYKSGEYECISNKLWEFTGKDVYICKSDEEYFSGHKSRIKEILANKDNWRRTEKILIQEKESVITSYSLTLGDAKINFIGYLGQNGSSNYNILGLFSEREDFNAQEVRIFRYALQSLNMAEAQRESDLKQQHRKYLKRLLSKNSDRVELEDVSFRRINLGEQNFVFVVYGEINTERYQEIYSSLEKLLSKYQVNEWSPIVSEYKDCLVFVLPGTSDNKIFAGDILELLMQYTPDGSELWGGLGTSVSLNEIIRSYGEARKALEWARAHVSKKFISFDELGVLQVVSRKNNFEDIKEYNTKYIKKIRDYDDANNTELYLTIRVYVENLWSYSQASKVLFIHLNTVKYRIRNVEKITGLDFSNPSARIIFEVALELEEFFI
jgi:sugar diacid utilization regulator